METATAELCLLILFILAVWLEWSVRKKPPSIPGQNLSKAVDRLARMALPATGRKVVVDTETTGLENDDRIVSLAIVNVIGQQSGPALPSYDYLIFNPQKKSHPKAEEVHGWDTGTLEHQDLFAQHAALIYETLSTCDLIIAHNAEFDMGFINRELALAGFPKLKTKTYCTMLAARGTWPGKPANLNACLERIGFKRRNRRRHGAFEDAFLTMKLYLYLTGDTHGADIVGDLPRPGNFHEPPPLDPRSRKFV